MRHFTGSHLHLVRVVEQNENGFSVDSVQKISADNNQSVDIWCIQPPTGLTTLV